jgi:hypothetical protein
MRNLENGPNLGAGATAFFENCDSDRVREERGMRLYARQRGLGGACVGTPGRHGRADARPSRVPERTSASYVS